MTGACGALHNLVDLSEIELTTVRFRVYLLDRRHQHEIRAGPFQQTRIGLRGAGIMSQVVFVVELGGIDEDAHHDGGVLPAGALDQRAVSACRAPIVGTNPIPDCSAVSSSARSSLTLVNIFISSETNLRGKGMNSRKHNEEKTEKKRRTLRRRRFPGRKRFCGAFYRLRTGRRRAADKPFVRKDVEFVEYISGNGKKRLYLQIFRPKRECPSPASADAGVRGLRFRNTLITALSGAGDDF